MTNKSAKEAALKILLENRLYSLIDYNDLKRIIESHQFIIIEYKKHGNSEYVSELIKRLRLEEETEQKDSFLFINSCFKLLFIDADVSPEDKCALLRHELGHICDCDFMHRNLQSSRIKREEFANEFSCYAKNPGIMLKLHLFVIKKWKLLASATALLVCVLGLPFMLDPVTTQTTEPTAVNTLTTELFDDVCYVTSSGKKYHRKSCVIVKYKTNLTELEVNEVADSGYKPCLICLTEEE